VSASDLSDESLMRYYDAVRKQVEADRDSKHKLVSSDAIKEYAESLRIELHKRRLPYTAIDWSADQQTDTPNSIDLERDPATEASAAETAQEKAVEPVEATETDVLDPVHPIDPTDQAVEPVDPADQADPSDQADQPDPIVPADQTVEPVDQADQADPSDLADQAAQPDPIVPADQAVEPVDQADHEPLDLVEQLKRRIESFMKGPDRSN
jgi:hypothetical protein